MKIEERHILRSLCGALSAMPEKVSENDRQFAFQKVSDTIAAMIGADEPIHNTEQQLQKATQLTQSLQSFVEQRNNEKWN